jgi:hypothetical protein
MIRKILFVAGAISLVSLIAFGLTFGLPAKATTSAAGAPAAVQGCNFPIPINKVDVGGRKNLGGHPVSVFWDAPSNLPNCVSVEKYTVNVQLKLPNATRQQEEIVPGNKTAATLQVRGFPTDRDPQSVTVTVTATLKINASSKGTKTEQVRLTP